MKRCKHLNCILTEEYVTASSHYFNQGKLITHLNDDSDGAYNGNFWIVCKDCDKIFIYSDRDNAPIWAKRLYDLATTEN